MARHPGVTDTGVPLGAMFDALGTVIIDVAVAPRGLDVPVAEVVIADQSVVVEAREGDVLLAVGVDPNSADVLDVIEAARKTGACAVVVKAAEAIEVATIHAAETADIALLRVSPATSWGHLLTLLRTALGARSEFAPEPGKSLQVGDLFGLANAIAAVVGGATTIEDLQSNVLAYSTLEQPIDVPRQDTILGRRVPAEWTRVLADRGVFRQMYHSDDVVRVPLIAPARAPEAFEEYDVESVHGPRLAVAVRAGGEALGSIWVMEGSEELGKAAEESLRAAAQTAAVHLLHHRARADLDRQRRGELVRSVLERSEHTHAAAHTLRLSSGASLTVLAFAPDLRDDDDAEAELERLVGLLTLHSDVYRRRAHTVCIDDTAYVLLSDPDVVDTKRVIELAGELRERTERRSHVGVRVGIGSTVKKSKDVAKSREEADCVVRVLQARGRPIGHIDDMREAIALMHLEDVMVDRPLLRAGKIRRLAEHDADKHTTHVPTLRAYLDCFGDVAAAADRLNIHPNTLRYRIARVVETSGIDLEDPGERLITHLQLRVLDRQPEADPS